MAQLEHDSPGKLLGAGRSGQVFLVSSQEGLIARKIFYTDKIASIIHYFFFGSPNPYVWNEDAIKCAFFRRQIIRELVQFWFGDNLKVAEAIATSWNHEFKAYQLDTEFILGRHVALRQPCNDERIDELHALVSDIMLPLQKKLIAAGLDGLVWQAGKGTPTALNNFLLANDTPGNYVFVWIDLESGVPALFGLNPLALFSFYLPKSIKYRRALFDDVDTDKLNRYLNRYRDELENKLGSQKYAEVLGYVFQLEFHQKKWKSMRRVDRSIQYQFKKRVIDEQQVQWYSEHPLFWYGRELLRIIVQLVYKLFIDLPVAIINKLVKVPYLQFFYQLWKFISSHRYRSNIARNYIAKRIEYWRNRKQLMNEEANSLLQQLKQESTSDYLNYFSVHLGIKIFFKIIEYLLIPLLYVLGLIDEFIFITWLIIGGPVYRTAYTSWRILQAALSRHEIPWVAFFVGLIPTLGILAYPCQIIYSAKGRKKKIAQFIIYDFFTRIGNKIPGWGGEDTQTEHFFNLFADRIAHSKKNIKKAF
ncbi:hypothetical protein A4S05_30545 [Nostoc sp. KVJ20]|uniref:hypothetical protein n=1 Tax=Nostoc sp. KVJ20 TaxID=457944 RepID=UPI00083D60A4|nr:hypothetical protein [Nostoc sp. KVJ20]ODH01068.1 hypothetical protein A4S05_30545 [Nostoc sp. KVJ20]